MIRFTDPTEHAEKLAERKATLLAKKAELEATLLESWHPAERKQLETNLGLVVHELAEMESQPCPPSQLEVLRAEVKRLEAENKQLREDLRLGMVCRERA